MVPIDLNAWIDAPNYFVPRWLQAWVLGFQCTAPDLNAIELLSVKVAGQESLTIHPLPLSVVLRARGLVLPIASASSGVEVTLRSSVDQRIEFGVKFSERVLRGLGS